MVLDGIRSWEIQYSYFTFRMSLQQVDTWIGWTGSGTIQLVQNYHSGFSVRRGHPILWRWPPLISCGNCPAQTCPVCTD